ncbi:MAG: NAD+ synthase [Candidatus Heimdallarchaeota archaeon]|nr:NAD+ synthase [Candidatus Heimdallarchaeota archaeon]
MSSNIQFVLCQINSRVGDISYNKNKIIEIIKTKARDGIISILVFPELSLSGYIPLDQLNYNDFHTQIEMAIEEIKSNTNSDIVILGAPRRLIAKNKILLYNSAYVIADGKILHIIDKTLLPNYDVFHEKRYFLPSTGLKVITIGDVKIGLQICEDMWDDRPEHKIRVTEYQVNQGAEIIINISASPYHWDKPEDRLAVVQNHINCAEENIIFAYVNLVGSQDEIVFDGRSFLVNNKGDLMCFLEPYKEDFLEFEYDRKMKQIISNPTLSADYVKKWEDEMFEAIKINLLDYLEKNNLNKSVLIALSGGIDSALTTVLATKILGKENVRAVYLPTKFSANESRESAQILSANLGIELLEIPINKIHSLMVETIQSNVDVNTEFSLADENIQPRIRSTILMYLSNKFDAMVISTGNKSEIACGYTTIYGDSVGGKNLIGDLYKNEVYKLSEYFNKDKEIIPRATITRPPTAELRPNQKDSDSLPEYDVLDAVLELIIEEELTIKEIIANGFEDEIVLNILKLVRRSEFKRSQICQTVKLKKRTFGIGRLYPVTSGFIP